MPFYWYIVEALIALHGPRKGGKNASFTRADLRAWSDKIRARPAAAQQAIDHGLAGGLFERAPSQPGQAKPGMCSYRLTAAGAAAAKAAYDSWKSDALSKAGTKASRVRPKDSFSNRLWSLLRIRKSLSGPEAAETLVDAGGNVTTVINTAAQYLRQWSAMHPDHIQVSKQRGRAGAHRYVLINDLGPVPPVTTSAPQKAQGGATA